MTLGIAVPPPLLTASMCESRRFNLFTRSLLHLLTSAVGT